MLLPVAAAAVLLRGVRPAWAWAGLPVQWGLLAAFAAPLARLNGYSFGGLMGALPYAWDLGLWAAGITAVQFALLLAQKSRRSGE